MSDSPSQHVGTSSSSKGPSTQSNQTQDFRRGNGNTSDSGPEDEDEGLGFFSDSLSALFNVHSPARGSPGGYLKWSHPDLPSPDGMSYNGTIAYGVPNHTGTSTKLFAHYQWDAGIELCKEMCSKSRSPQVPHNPFNPKGKSVCELGAGTGLPSLVCARLGAQQVVVTDYPDEGILRTLKENAQSQKEETIRVEGLMWGNVEQEGRVLRHNPQGFDLIIICDTLWVSSSHPVLIHSLLSLLSHTARDARVLVSAGFHTGRLCVRRFFEMCQEGAADAELGKLIPDEEAGGIWERNVLTGATRQWSNGSTVTDEESLGEIEERAKSCAMAVLKWIP